MKCPPAHIRRCINVDSYNNIIVINVVSSSQLSVIVPLLNFLLALIGHRRVITSSRQGRKENRYVLDFGFMFAYVCSAL